MPATAEEVVPMNILAALAVLVLIIGFVYWILGAEGEPDPETAETDVPFTDE